MELENPESGLTLAVLIPTLYSSRGRQQQETVLAAASWFQRLDVPVVLIYCEGPDRHPPVLEYLQDDGKLFEKFGFRQMKNLFGQSVLTNLSGMVLVQEDRVVASARRIHWKNLESFRIKALDFQVKQLKTHWKSALRP